MKMTIDGLRKQYETAQLQMNAKNEEIRNAERALAALKREQEQAAQAGDIERFDALAEQIQKDERRLYVLIKSARVSGIVTPEAAREAWINYAADFGKKQAARLANYDKKRRELCRDYEELITEQNRALLDREIVAEMAGTDAGSYDMPEWIPTDTEEAAPRSYGGHAPDADLFTSARLWPCNFDIPEAPGRPHWAGIETANTVICDRRPINGALDFGHK